ncbi:IS110 family transposase [Spirosoma soli]|uniref:IS110 family transposase n=1 Tax=Spirosoma soli TaxID=1770529 RepID=A0ABW5MCH6_9BACT
MQFHYFIGIDVSKNTLDWAVYTSAGLVGQFQSDNSAKAVGKVVKQLIALPQFTVATSICCLEHTGIYNAHVLEVLYQEGFFLWLEASIQIKQAGGLQRGKSDAIDAIRIAEYAYRFRDRLRIWQPTRSVLKQLTELSQLRHRLQAAINQLAVPLTEQKRFGDRALQCQLKNHCDNSLKALRKDLEQVEASLKSLIQHDTELKTLFSLLTSIPGVGTIVATEIVIATDEFKAITEPKKLACHAGVAPFEHRSGSSVRGRTRVNHHARKSLKTLLHLASMAAVKSKGELQVYYQRKVKEGKNRMLVLNAVRNKLIHRVYAVVRRNEKYDKNYTPILV